MRSNIVLKPYLWLFGEKKKKGQCENYSISRPRFDRILSDVAIEEPAHGPLWAESRPKIMPKFNPV
jgi:hypothetical protein